MEIIKPGGTRHAEPVVGEPDGTAVGAGQLGAESGLTACRCSGVEPNQSKEMVLTDTGNEPDDAQLIVRFLLDCNEFDVEGLVATTSTHLEDRTNPQRIAERVEAYGEVRDRLLMHVDGYPTEVSLRGRIESGHPRFGIVSVGDAPLKSSLPGRGAGRTPPAPPGSTRTRRPPARPGRAP